MDNMKIRRLVCAKRHILPNELLSSLNQTDEVIVNRVSINIRILEIQRSKTPNLQALRILSDATEQIAKMEHKRCGAIFGAKMSVENILLAFGGKGKIGQLPYNTFMKK